jgi:hypothetical protein
MAQRKLRVLLDLSMAARGHCGIAQDVRLLYRALASSPEIDVTGLVYCPFKFGPVHRFLPRGAARADRVANQSAFLWAFAEGDGAWPSFKPLRSLQKWRRVAATLRAAKPQLDELEVDMFWSVMWRLLFAPTLSADAIPLVQDGKFLLSTLSSGMVYARALSHRRPIKLDTRGYDYLIVQGPRPFQVAPETRQIVRYHDMIQVLHPDTLATPLVIKWHHQSIRQSRGDTFFVCNSQPSRDDLVEVYPELCSRSLTIPNILSDAYRPDSNHSLVGSILRLRRSSALGKATTKKSLATPRYIMGVSTLEPRKNFLGLIQAFCMLKDREAIRDQVRDLKLVIVGKPGWKFEPILAAMRGLARRGDVVHLENVPTDELRVLYSHAEAFVSPSTSEGFGLPPAEAMQCGAPVVVSDLPAHRWVLGNAAVYCNPYDAGSIAAAIEPLVAGEGREARRATMAARGREQVQRYRSDRCGAQWLELLKRLSAPQLEPVVHPTTYAELEPSWRQRVA